MESFLGGTVKDESKIKSWSGVDNLQSNMRRVKPVDYQAAANTIRHDRLKLTETHIHKGWTHSREVAYHSNHNKSGKNQACVIS